MSDPRLAALLLALAAVAIYFVAIGVVLRLARQRHGVSLLVALAAILYAAVALAAHATMAVAPWHFAAFYGAAVAATIFAYGAALKALSLRMLLVMADAADASATTDHLLNGTIRTSFEERIAALERRQLIRREGGGYVLTELGRRAAARIIAVQSALNMGVSGFYWD
jgi:hypothetical protein